MNSTYFQIILMAIRSQGSVAEWSKALVLGTSLSGGVGSNPTAAKFLKDPLERLWKARIDKSYFIHCAGSSLQHLK